MLQPLTTVSGTNRRRLILRQIYFESRRTGRDAIDPLLTRCRPARHNAASPRRRRLPSLSSMPVPTGWRVAQLSAYSHPSRASALCGGLRGSSGV